MFGVNGSIDRAPALMSENVSQPGTQLTRTAAFYGQLKTRPYMQSGSPGSQATRLS
jgi:hypothetical protein